MKVEGSKPKQRSTPPVTMSSVAKELPKPKLLRMTAESTAELGLKVLFALGLALGLESPRGSPTVTAETGAALRKVASLAVSCVLWGLPGLLRPFTPTKVRRGPPIPARVFPGIPAFAKPGPVVGKCTDSPILPTAVPDSFFVNVKLLFFFCLFQSAHSVQRTLVRKVTFPTTRSANS